MDKLFTLLSLQRQAQDAETPDRLAHVITNETLKIVPYKQAVYWSAEGTRIHLKSASGNMTLDDKSPYALVLKKIIRQNAFGKDAPQENVLALSPDGSENPGALMIFKTNSEGIMGGVWLEREEPFQTPELQILSELAISYAHALAIIQLRHNVLSRTIWSNIRKARLYIFAALLVTLFLPVRLSITAPAEIIAQKPFVISAPYEGTLENILIQPGDPIAPGQALAEMDKISLDARLKSVRQELEIAKANLARLRRESLSSPEKKIELKKLESDIATKKIEFNYAQDMMERSHIRSPQKGIAIFADKNSLQGKPMRMGEKIMLIANPQDSELLIRVPASSMIPLRADVEIKFFLNVSPLKGHTAKIRSIGYQASADSDGLLTYKIHAHLPENRKSVRIGWKGTAKIYGERTFLGYALLRRPLVSLRELFGV